MRPIMDKNSREFSYRNSGEMSRTPVLKDGPGKLPVLLADMVNEPADSKSVDLSDQFDSWPLDEEAPLQAG